MSDTSLQHESFDEMYWEVAYTFSRVWPDDKAAKLLSEPVERYGL